MKEKTNTDWPAVFKALEKWRSLFLSGPTAEDTAVTELADKYTEGTGKAWAVLVSTILSLRTKDEVTRTASRRLLSKAPGPAELLTLGVDATTRLVYPAGFYRTKAANLIKIASLLLEQYNGTVPSDMETLLELPGVGRKTANLVLTEAFDMYGICVDIHVHRICNRAGWTETSTPDKTEMTLREILPRRYWKIINGLLVLYGQKICRPQSPFCSLCVMGEHCRRLGVERQR